jgi:group I intron endonuclease
MFVYKITNICNGKTYIGITKDIKSRFKYHTTRYLNKRCREYNKLLYKSFRKYGINNFKFEILYKDITEKEAISIESELIKSTKSLSHENGYNISPGNDYYNIKGEKVNTCVLTESQAQSIVDRRNMGEKRKNVYSDFSGLIGYSGFQQIWRGKNWAWLKGQENPFFIKGNAKFSISQVKEMKILFKQGHSASEVSKKFHICYHTAYNMKRGFTYSYVTV